MPLVGIPVSRLKQLLGKDLDRDDLQVALENLGNDVDGYAVVKRFRCDRCGEITEVLEHEDFNDLCAGCAGGDLVEIGSAEVVRIDLLPVRPDMLSAAGLARALRGFLGIETGLPEFKLSDSGFRVEVKSGMDEIRPYIVGAIVRGLRLGDEGLRMVMKMQENLHWALGRNRRRASIGVYDLGTIEPGFVFRPVKPDELKFVPLFGLPDSPRAELTPKQILKKHPKGIGYAHLLAGMSTYPLLTDSAGKVLSMPPIINSDDTKMTPETTDVFIDVTGPDRNAITRSLNVLVAALADMGGNVGKVEIKYPDGTSETTPDLTPARCELDPAEARRVLGLDLDAGKIAELLRKMRYGAKTEGSKVVVDIPAYRSDILHEQDIIEDIAIGYGYHNIEPRLVPTMTVSRALPVEEISEAVRRVMTGFGLFEVMTSVLVSEKEQFELMRLPVTPHVTLENPVSVEQTMLRTSLIPGLLSTFRANSTREMPQQIFECQDVFFLDSGAETGVRTRRRVAVGLTGPKVGFADVRALASALARELNAEAAFTAANHHSFITGRCARIDTRGEDTGILGEMHPEVLERFGLGQPVAVFEFELDHFIKAYA
ncbi:MAG: phenylalanine--tRNA ligase subunit beta [candidate division WOR-3 bacterium]|nr:MAG: phenylalanine--tRNA ligase subunit beta [candidate division WOR-3 bacterium]